MEWIDTLKAIGITTASQILIFIVIGYFAKQIIEYFLSKGMELKKAELN